MLPSNQSRIRNSRPWLNSIQPLSLFLFVLASFLVFQEPRCLASTAGTNRSDRKSTHDGSVAMETRNTAGPDAAARPADANDAPGTKAEDSRLEVGDDAFAFTAGSSAVKVNELPLGIVNVDKHTMGSAHSLECSLFRESLCWAAKNKSSLALAALQTAALVADGVTTRQFLRRGYVEVDPLARIFIGRKPTWARMAPLGAVQVFAGAWLGEQMAMSRHTWVRRLWWLPQVIGIVGNAAATAHNVALP
jgi:hypothetical protein